MPDTSFTHYIDFTGSESNGTLSWTVVTPTEFANTVIDVADDGNVDSDDYVFYEEGSFSGYYYQAPNGLTFAIFEDTSFPTAYYIPYNPTDYDLAAVFPATGSTSLFDAEDFVPTGNPICFLAGTRIETPKGSMPVEDLQIGDYVLSADGTAVSVRFNHRQSIATRFGAAERLMPVRVRAGALGGGLPHRDLTLTADHALLIDGLLINAGALVNGSSIDFVPLREFDGSYTVYHIETENHDVILAEGAPAETYIDYVARRAFDNYAEYVALYGEERTIAEIHYPRVSSARQLPPGVAARFGIGRAA